MDVVTRRSRIPFIDGLRAMRGWFIASLVCNMGIIVTGAVVRVTGSGLGCPTWPQCHEGSYVPHAAAGYHSYIEFGNRLLTFVLAIVALGAFISAWRTLGARSKLWWLTLGIGLGIPMQGVVGGITVLMQLNPWVVALHLLLSVALVVLCVWAVCLGYDARPEPVGVPGRVLAIVTFASAMLAIWLGTVATGAGPHAGDADAVRNGLDILVVTRLHGLSAWLCLGLSLACVVWFTVKQYRRALVPAWTLLIVVLLQGVIGYTQYFLGLPLFVVVLHLFGMSLLAAAAAWVLFATTSQRDGSTAPSAVGSSHVGSASTSDASRR